MLDVTNITLNPKGLHQDLRQVEKDTGNQQNGLNISININITNYQQRSIIRATA